MHLLFDLNFPLKDPVLILAILLFIILLAPILLRKLRIPSIVGLILAGMALGDHGFNVITKDSIVLFSQAGLLYIMFLAGLELDMAEFKKNKYKSIIFGLLTFTIPLACGFWVCTHILHFDFMEALIVSSMFATHTLVAYPIASRMGIAKNEAATIAVGGTIITDTAVLLILAGITGSTKGETSTAFWAQMAISFILFALVVLFIFPYIGRKFFKFIKDDQSSHFIFVLAMVFLAAFFAELAGIEAIVGAFLAGLALNQLIPHSSPLMNKIEFTGNALFIPFFLISVGMLVDLGVLFKGTDALWIALVLTTMAIATKYIAALITRLVFKYSAAQGNLIFGLTSAHAAATIAVILIGFQLGIVTETVLNGTILLILITCLTASFITANAAKKIAIAEANAIPTLPEGHEKIMIVGTETDRNKPLIDFAALLKDPKSFHNIDVLSMVLDGEEVKEKVLMNMRQMETTIHQAAAANTGLQVLTRVELNPSNGISKAVKERLVSDLIMDWPQASNNPTDFLLKSFFGTETQNTISQVWETIYLCRFQHLLNISKNIRVFVGANAALEIGFSHWLKRVIRVSRQIDAKLNIYSNSESIDSIKKYILENKLNADIAFYSSTSGSEFMSHLKKASSEDFFIVVGARKGTLSYDSQLENIPAKLIKNFPNSNVVIIYPEQKEVDFIKSGMHEEDLELSPIQEQINNINKIGKAVKKIFNPETNDESVLEEENEESEKDKKD